MKSGPAPALSGSTPQMDKGAHDALPDPETEGAAMMITPWWHFIVLRGDGLPARLDGLWLDVSDLTKFGPLSLRNYGHGGVQFEVTNQWEQRDDGQVAVVVRHFEGRQPPGT